MATITPVLWKHKQNRKGMSPIYLRIEAGGKTRYRSLRVYLRESQWNENSSRVRRGHPQSERINALIAERVSDAEREILKLTADGEKVSAGEIKQRLSGGADANDGDFLAYAEKVVDEFERRSKLYTARRYRSICRKLEGFAGRPLKFESITLPFLREYETHLIEEHDNSPNTVASNLRCIRAILNRAIRDGLAAQGANPFFHFKIRRVRAERTKLSLGQIDAIERLDLTMDTLIWHVRNYFLFSFYCAGIRFGDLARLRCSNVRDGRLSYTMSKTGTGKSIKLVPQAQEIVRHYASENAEALLFPILADYDTSTPRKMLNAISAQNALVNKYLKKIADLADIEENVSFHIARHSFADLARSNGWDVYVISKALGHSDLKTTERYLKGFDADGLDARMDVLFSREDV